jgi:hypothetical protein
MRIFASWFGSTVGPTEYKDVATMTWPLQAGSASYRVNIRERDLGFAIASAPRQRRPLPGSDAL